MAGVNVFSRDSIHGKLRFRRSEHMQQKADFLPEGRDAAHGADAARRGIVGSCSGIFSSPRHRDPRQFAINLSLSPEILVKPFGAYEIHSLSQPILLFCKKGYRDDWQCQDSACAVHVVSPGLGP